MKITAINEFMSKEEISNSIENCVKKINGNLPKFSTIFPSSNSINYMYGALNPLLNNDDWTSGFWTGLLWMAYEYTNDEKFKKVAMSHRKLFQIRLTNNIGLDHHDVGFLYIPSVIAQNKILNDEISKKVGLEAAEYLYKNRFNNHIGFLQAWGEMNSESSCRMIIDSFLNIPIFMWRHSITGEKKYKNAALNHIDLATKLLIREDGTTYHSYFFDSKTGKPLKGETVQGYSDSSCWSRGQAWGIYGMAFAYEYTKEKKYYDLFLKLTNNFIKRLPEDMVPYWDLVFQNGDEPRDTSALTIATSGIMHMTKLIQNDEIDKLKEFVHVSTKSLINNYTTFKNPERNGLLTDGVYNKNSWNGVEESNLWGDFFFMDTLMKLLNEDWKSYW